jgi:hypothetical protein
MRYMIASPSFIHAFSLMIRSEVDDVNLGLDHFYGDFNVVHARLIASGVSTWWVRVSHM